MYPQNNPIPDKKQVREIIDRALSEDTGGGDVTTNALIGANRKAEAVWKAKESGVIAGLDVAGTVFKTVDPELVWRTPVGDGMKVKAGDTVAEIGGSCRALLTAERTALNLVQRMSGIATATARYLSRLEGSGTKILDTRKTAPGLRILDKYAVRRGGGENHRMGLYDMALIKENHITAAGSIAEAVRLVRRSDPEVRIEVETANPEQVEEALAANADMIMLDNMDPPLMKSAVETIGSRALTEASGNITLENVGEIAETGVDYISVGALTHSVKAFDISQYLVDG